MELEDLLNMVLVWQGMEPQTGMGPFVAGDALVDFSVTPDGMTMSGVVTNTFTPGTYLKDQFASVGVRFRSTKSPSNAPLNDIGVGVVGGADPANNHVQGVIHPPPLGMDGRVVWEIRFEAPVQRAGVRRGGLLNYDLGYALTNFYNESGGLIESIRSDEIGAFVSLEVGPGEPGISRVEITSNAPGFPEQYGAGTADDLFFSPVPGFEVPPALLYEP